MSGVMRMKELIYNRVVRQGTLGVPHDLLWYYRSIGLDEQELTVVLLLFGHAQRYSNYYPDLSKIAAIMEVKKSAVQEIIASLMEKECLSVEREFSLDQQDAHYVFSFDPLFKKLGRVLSDQESKQRDAHQNRLQEELQQSVHRTEESAADPLKDKD